MQMFSFGYNSWLNYKSWHFMFLCLFTLTNSKTCFQLWFAHRPTVPSAGRKLQTSFFDEVTDWNKSLYLFKDVALMISADRCLGCLDGSLQFWMFWKLWCSLSLPGGQGPLHTLQNKNGSNCSMSNVCSERVVQSSAQKKSNLRWAAEASPQLNSWRDQAERSQSQTKCNELVLKKED